MREQAVLASQTNRKLNSILRIIKSVFIENE